MAAEQTDFGYYIGGGSTLGIGPKDNKLYEKSRQAKLDKREAYGANHQSVIVVKGVPVPQVDVFSHVAHDRFKSSWEKAWELLRYEDPEEENVIYVRDYDLDYTSGIWIDPVEKYRKPTTEVPVTPELNIIFDERFDQYWNGWIEFNEKQSKAEKEAMQRAGLSWEDAPECPDGRTWNIQIWDIYHTAMETFKEKVMAHASLPVPQIPNVRVDEIGPILETISKSFKPQG